MTSNAATAVRAAVDAVREHTEADGETPVPVAALHDAAIAVQTEVTELADACAALAEHYPSSLYADVHRALVHVQQQREPV